MEIWRASYNRGYELSGEDLNFVMDVLDKDGDGTVSLEELIDFVERAQHSMGEYRKAKASTTARIGSQVLAKFRSDLLEISEILDGRTGKVTVDAMRAFEELDTDGGKDNWSCEFAMNMLLLS